MDTLIACLETPQPARVTAITSMTSLAYVQDTVANLPSPPTTVPVTRHNSLPVITKTTVDVTRAQSDPSFAIPATVTSIHTPPPTPGATSSSGPVILQSSHLGGLGLSLTPQSTSNTSSPPDASLVIDTLISVATGITTRKPHPRELTGAILYQWMDIDAHIEEKWEGTLRSRIDELVKGAVRSRLEHMQETMFAAKKRHWPHRQEERRPSIVISVANSDDCKAVKKMLRKHPWLKKEISSCGLRLMVVEDPTKLQSKGRGAQDAPATSTHKATFVLGTTGPNLPSTYCGTLLSVTNPAGATPTTFTLGGTVIIDDAVYGLTSGHAFFNLETSSDRQISEATSSSQSTSEDCINEWLDDSCNPFVFKEDEELSAEASTSDDASAKCSLQDLQSAVHRSSQNAPDALKIHGAPSYEVKVLAPSLGVQNTDSDGLGLRNCDWALVELPKDVPVPQNQYIETGKEVPILGAILNTKRPSGRVKIVVRTDHILEGHLRANAASYRVGSCLFDVRLVYMNDQIPAGCSGAWVLQDNVVCGYVVAARSDARCIYMLPIQSILQDVRNTIGCQDVFIPVNDDVAQQTQARIRPGRLCDITTREKPDLAAQGGQFDGAEISYDCDDQPPEESEDPSSHPSMPIEPQFAREALPQILKPAGRRPPLRPKKGSSVSVTHLRTQSPRRSSQPALTVPSAESKSETQHVQRNFTAQVFGAFEVVANLACWPFLHTQRYRTRKYQPSSSENAEHTQTTEQNPEHITAPAIRTLSMLHKREMQQNQTALSQSVVQTLFSQAPIEMPAEAVAVSMLQNSEPLQVPEDDKRGDKISFVLPFGSEDSGYNSKGSSRPLQQLLDSEPNESRVFECALIDPSDNTIHNVVISANRSQRSMLRVVTTSRSKDRTDGEDLEAIVVDVNEVRLFPTYAQPNATVFNIQLRASLHSATDKIFSFNSLPELHAFEQCFTSFCVKLDIPDLLKVTLKQGGLLSGVSRAQVLANYGRAQIWAHELSEHPKGNSRSRSTAMLSKRAQHPPVPNQNGSNLTSQGTSLWSAATTLVNSTSKYAPSVIWKTNHTGLSAPEPPMLVLILGEIKPGRDGAILNAFRLLCIPLDGSVIVDQFKCACRNQDDICTEVIVTSCGRSNLTARLFDYGTDVMSMNLAALRIPQQHRDLEEKFYVKKFDDVGRIVIEFTSVKDKKDFRERLAFVSDNYTGLWQDYQAQKNRVRHANHVDRQVS